VEASSSSGIAEKASRAEGVEMIDGFSRRSVILFVIAMLAATALTIEGDVLFDHAICGVIRSGRPAHEGRRLVTGAGKVCEEKLRWQTQND
jgi:hypothetical protein